MSYYCFRKSHFFGTLKYNIDKILKKLKFYQLFILTEILKNNVLSML